MTSIPKGSEASSPGLRVRRATLGMVPVKDSSLKGLQHFLPFTPTRKRRCKLFRPPTRGASHAELCHGWIRGKNATSDGSLVFCGHRG